MTQPLPPLTDEELAHLPRSAPDDAGFGSLKTDAGCLPLKALTVRARIDGLVAHTEVRQTFVNAFAEPLEATYIFPLPDRAAVTRFRFEVAGRVIEGDLKERGAARRDYDEAVRAGHRAAITEEERPGVFTMRVGNLPPGESATVELTMTGPLPYGEGEATFRFPLVVAPRYIPGTPLPGPSVGTGVEPDTDAVPDASRVTPPVLLPGFPNPVLLAISVEFPASPLAPAAVRSSLHAVTEEAGAGTTRVVLWPGERLDRDFILRFRLAEDRVRTGLHVQPDATGDEGTFLLTVVPPAALPQKPRPRDIVFVLDRSGSMAGWKMVAARRAMGRMVDTLTDADRFTVLAFDDRIVSPPFGRRALVPATDARRFQAVEFLGTIDAANGTEMAQPLTESVNLLAAGDGGRDRQRILVLVTDGQVGNEDQILRELGAKLKGIRVFTLGIDQAVNAGFLQRLAGAGGGECELVESEMRLDEVMDKVHRHIGTPLLTGLKVEPAGLRFVPDSLVPARLPDLFAGTPLMIHGRYKGRVEGGLALQARDTDGAPWSATVRVSRDDCPAVASVWARGRVRELEDRYAVQPSEGLSKQIVDTSLRFGVLCRFTAFVAVDRSEVVNAGGEQHRVTQPVELPAGWDQKRRLRAGPVLACEALTLAAPRYGAYPRAAPARAAESVDSMLAEFADCELRFDDDSTAPQKAPTPGLLDRLLAKVGLGGAAEGPAAAVDRDFFRARAHGLRTGLAGAADDAGAKLSALRTHAAEMRRLVDDLRQAGEADPSVERLGEVVREVEELLTVLEPADATVLAVWQRLEQALAAYLATFGAAPTATTAPARDAFWK